jgi:beta-glucosidase
MMNKRNILVIAFAAFTFCASSASDDPNMDTFIDRLMSKMTLREKIGQLNLPVTGDIVTGQAKSSNVADKIKKRRGRRTLQS